MLFCQALPKSTHFTVLRVLQNSLLKNTKLFPELYAPGYKTSSITGRRYWVIPAAAFFVPRNKPTAISTVGFNEKQSHQHLLFIVQTAQTWREKKREKGVCGGRISVPAELHSISPRHSARDAQVLNKIKQLPAKTPRKTATYCKHLRVHRKIYQYTP